MLTVKDIVEEFLNKNGFDGLINDDDCFCLTAEICDGITGDCYAYKCDDECECNGAYDFHMTRTKNETN